MKSNGDDSALGVIVLIFNDGGFACFFYLFIFYTVFHQWVLLGGWS